MAGLRPARPTDAGAMGLILWRFQDDNDWMPNLYSIAETIGFCGVMIERFGVVVAEIDGKVEGFLARDGEEICALYLSRKAKRQRIGRQLMEYAKGQSRRLRLRAFQANIAAHRFYRRQGFVEVGRSDGAGNDENLPDVSYVWPKEAAK